MNLLYCFFLIFQRGNEPGLISWIKVQTRVLLADTSQISQTLKPFFLPAETTLK